MRYGVYHSMVLHSVHILFQADFRLITVNRRGMVGLATPRDKYVIVHFLFLSCDQQAVSGCLARITFIVE